MKAYSFDLRQKVVDCYAAGGITQRRLAVQFRVSLFFVVKVLGLHRRGERLEAKKRGGRVKPLLTSEMRQFIRGELVRQNDLTLSELSVLVEEQFGVTVSAPTLCRALRQMDLRRKKRLFSPAND
jgi:transposase